MGNAFASAALRIGGDGVRPSLFTELLQVAPDKKWRKDEPFVDVLGRTRKRRIGLWMYDSSNHFQHDDAYDPLPHVNHIIQVFSGKRTLFDQIRGTGGIRISFIIEWGVSHGNYTLDKQLIGTIFDLGVDDINLIFIGIDEEDSTETTLTKLSHDEEIQVVIFNESTAPVLIEINNAISNIEAGCCSRRHFIPYSEKIEITVHSRVSNRHAVFGIDFAGEKSTLMKTDHICCLVRRPVFFGG
jgi:hypothetical protein